MAGACDPNGLCPRCGYRNGPGASRCLRCRAALAVPKGCSGECTRCLISALAGGAATGRRSHERKMPAERP